MVNTGENLRNYKKVNEMDYVSVIYESKKPKLHNPILIEGLPGIGNVGKLAVEHLIDSINAKKFAELYSKDFPPQVFINTDGTIALVNNEFYYWKAKSRGEPKVLCATTDKNLVKTMKKYGAVFKKNEPGGGIVGASGLLLGLGKMRGMKGTCFMGETPGYLVDPKSAKAVLKILMKITKIDLNLSALEKKAKEIEHIAHQLKEMEGLSKDKSEELKYIG